MNVFRHGRSAISLRLHHETLPAREKRLVYDVVHCHFGPNGARAVRLRQFGALRGPVITTFPGYDANKLPRVHGPKIYDELFAHGDTFTVGSEFMHTKLINLGAPKSKLVCLPIGVDLSFLPPRDKTYLATSDSTAVNALRCRPRVHDAPTNTESPKGRLFF